MARGRTSKGDRSIHAHGRVGLLALALGCGEEIVLDDSERALVVPPTAEFDPSGGVIPFPSNLLIDPDTGRLALPPGCGESPDGAQAELRAALNQLDGFATLGAVVRLPMSEAIDLSTAEGRVWLLRLAERGEPLAQPESPVPLRLLQTTRSLLDESCDVVGEASELLAFAETPLEEASTYAAFVLAGMESSAGDPIQASPVWSLVRQAAAPVELAQGESEEVLVVRNATPFDPTQPDDLASIVGLAQLWQAHVPVLQAFDALSSQLAAGSEPLQREDLLVATAFRTQTLSDAFNAAVAGSAAAQFSSESLLQLPEPSAGADAPLTVEELYALALPGASCEALSCSAMGSLFTGLAGGAEPSVAAISFQQGEDCDSSLPEFGGAFSDPQRPESVCERTLPLLVALPASEPGPAGYPTVVFGHGLGRSKEDLLAFAGSLARAGFASVAMDAVHHGARAVQITSEAELGCAGAGEGLPCEQALGPTCAPQCYAPLLSADLAVTRDNLRQTVLDQLQLIRALRRCTEPFACGALRVDPSRVSYVGQSLGALVGAVTLPVSGLGAGVLNVGAGGWLQVLVETETDDIRCPLVDALIAGDVLRGEVWGAERNPEALCLSADWTEQADFAAFAQVASWLLAPVDGLSYARAFRTAEATAAQSVLLGEVVGDPVIPNAATEALGMSWGLTPTTVPAVTSADGATPEVSLPGSQWLIYESQPADAELGFPGNAYAHGSLLSPAAGDVAGAGQLGTARMQADVVRFLLTHP